MDVETLNVVLNATYTPAVRGLAIADDAFTKTTVAARGLETASVQTGRAVRTAGADAASVEGQVSSVGAAFDRVGPAAAAAAREADGSLALVGDEATAVRLKLGGVSTGLNAIPASAAAAADGTDASLRTIGASTEAVKLGADSAAGSLARIPAAASGAAAKSDLSKVGKEARGTASAVTGMGRAFAYASNAFLAGAGIGFLLKKIYDDTTNLQDAQTQLGNVVGNTGGDWEKQRGAIEKYVGGLSDLSKFSPADLTNDLTRLDGVTQNVAKSERDLALATNIARATHKPLDTVVRALTLAEAGRTTGLSRLGIVLPKVTTQQDALRAKLAQLKSQGLGVSAAVKSEAMARAKAADGLVSFGTAIGGLTKKYGDADKVFGKTGAGHLADLKKNAEELATSVGKVLVPEIDKGVISVDDWFTGMTKSGKAQRDVREGISVIGDVFHTVAPAVKGAADAVGGFGNVLKIVLGLYGAKLALDFGRAIDKDIRTVVSFGKTLYGIGAKAVGVAGKLLGIGGSGEEAAAAVDGDSMTMQESLNALNETIQRLIATLGEIPVSASEATSATDAQFVVMGTGAEELQLQLGGVSTAFQEMPAAAAAAADETSPSLAAIGDGVLALDGQLGELAAGFAALPPAAAAGAAGTDSALSLIGDEAAAVQLQIDGLGVAIGELPAVAVTTAADTDAALQLIGDEAVALTLQIDGIGLALGTIPVEAAAAAAETDTALGLVGGEVNALQLQIDGLETSFAGIATSAATAAAEADTSLGLIGTAAADAAGEVTVLDTALSGIGAAAAAGAATAAGVLEGLAGLTTATFGAAAAGAAAVVASSGSAPNVPGIQPGTAGADIANLAASGKIPESVLKAAAKKAHISPDTPAGQALQNPTVLAYLTKYAEKHDMTVTDTGGGLTGPSGTPGAPNAGFTPPGLGTTPQTPAEKAAAQQKKLAAQAARAQRQFEAEAKADQASWEKLIAGGATPLPTKTHTSALDKVLPTGRQAAVDKAQAAAKSGNVTAERHLIQVAQQQLDYLNKEHASGQQLVVLERERAKLAGIIAAAHKKISSELVQQTNTAVGRREEKILGIGANGAQTSPGQVALKTREHKILDNEIAKMFGGSKHSIAVAAQNLGVSTATLLHGTNEQLIAEMKKLGIKLPATTLDSLNKINAVLKNKFLPPDVRANLQARLTQIEDTLNSGMTALSNMKPVKSTDLVKGLGLDSAQKITLESRIAQEMAHGGKVPSGRAADGVALTSTNTPVGKKPPHAATKAAGSKGGKHPAVVPRGLKGLNVPKRGLGTPTPANPPTQPHLELATSTAGNTTTNVGGITINITGADGKTAKQLAREIAPEIINELAKHQLRRGGGT